MRPALDMHRKAAKRSAWIAVVGIILWGAVLWPLHDVLPMWVEGMPAYMDQLVAMVHAPCATPTNTIRLGRLTLPLAIDAYQGPLNTYLDAPLAWSWLDGSGIDLYAYRYKGIALLAVASMLFFLVLLRIVPPAIAVLATFVFATLPINAVTALSDLQYHVALYAGVLGILYPSIRYVESRKPVWLLAAAFFGGFALWTRAEALIWTAAAGIVYALAARHTALANAWRTATHRRMLALGCLVAFLLGAAPIVAFTAIAPENSLFGFLLQGGAVEAARGQLLQTFAVRLQQFANFNLLNRWGLYEVRTPHWLFAAAFAVSATIVFATWLQERKITFPMLALLVVLPLSVLAHRGPREIHLLPLTLAITAVLAEGAARLRAPAGTLLLAVVLIANLLVDAADLREWEATRRQADTLLTHSCPSCLARRLEAYAPGASFYFTNIGLYQEALWGSRARVCGVDILNWGNDAAFRSAVRDALEDKGIKVFVAFPAERERAIPGRALPRTEALIDVLQSSGAGYRTELVPGVSGRNLYELFVVTSQAPTDLEISGGGVNRPISGTITGWLSGAGFRATDRVAIDGHPLPTTFGSSGLVTFAIPESEARGRPSLRVQLLRGRNLHPADGIVLPRP